WIHAVSLGEARAAAILIDELRRQAPGIRLLLTHGTATGREEGAKLLQTGDIQVWQPWDTPGAVARFLDRFAPRIGVLMETEVWPELTAACAERGIPLVLANARLNEKSLASAERLAWLARPAYSALAAVWAQTEADAHRLVSLGAKVAGVFGNMKFDAAPETRQLIAAANLREKLPKPVVVFASSRDGEEAQFLEVLKRFGATSPVPPVQAAVNSIAKRVQDVQWMIVPRHPQRFDEVAALVASHGFAVARRSTAGEAPGDAEIWLGDSLGEMALYYGLAEVALLGGSFAPFGGQNLIEAAACACPVVMGPSTFNFAEAAELSIAAGAAQRVPDMEHAIKLALALVADPARHEAMVNAALGFSSSNRGAAQRTAAALLAIAEPAPVAP
ncbi:MAG: 3-deoxy-D-manno-octulosonic acid transferase, partial [Comamonadaceae bacterium]